MMHLVPRALAAALAGALAGPACLVVAYALNPQIVFDMDRDVAPIAGGFYPVERGGDDTFAWTTERAELALPGLDRRAPWSCTVRFRGARPDPSIPQPDLALVLDGVTATSARGSNAFQDVRVQVPVRPSEPGLTLVLLSSQTFVPSPSDSRPLGVQVDRVACQPEGSWVLPPRRALGRAAMAAALFGAAAGLSGITAGSAVGAGSLLAAAQAWPLSTGWAPYTPYPAVLVSLALWIALAMLAALQALEWWNGQVLRNTARFVVIFSAGALYLKLLTLLHPSKLLVDAVFHAHRFEWVLDGRFYFTQLSTAAVPFPYAIGLYVFAAPWALLTRDHVTLLRVVVCASEVIAGGLIYWMVVRAWGDRLNGALAVGLFNLVPLAYEVVGHANLTNAFGQSAALVTVAAMSVWTLAPGRPATLAALTLLATLAFMSHVSTFALLLPTLVAAAVFYWWWGGPSLTAPARAVALAAVLAVMLAVSLYYGHFIEVYEDVYEAQLAKTRTPAAEVSNAPPAPEAALADEAGGGRARFGVSGMLAQLAANVGWPILTLALVGIWRVSAEGGRDRLALTVGAWGAAFVVFVLLRIAMPVDPRYQQDAWEFLARVHYATYPAAVILAARGAAWALRGGRVARLAAGAILLGAVTTGVGAWRAWLQ